MKNNFKVFCSLLLALCLILPVFALNAFAESGGQVSGVVWVDKDADGLFNNNEKGYNNVTVSLHKMYGSDVFEQIMTMNTGKDGAFAFSTSEDGEYMLTFELPNDYRFTLHGLDSSALPAQGRESRTVPFTLSGGSVITCNAGAVSGNSYVSIVAFEDLNLNGGRRDSEPRVRYVETELYYLYDEISYLVATATTDRNGETSMTHLSPGTYYLKATLPENFVAGPLGTKISNFYNCMQPSVDNICYTAPFELPSKGSVSLGIGVVTTGTLTGSLWQDDNGNQKKDGGEGGCSAATVTMSSQELNISRTVAVNADGTFRFTGMQPAQYDLTFSLPEGMIFADSSDSMLQDIAREASLSVQIEAEKNTHVDPVGATAASSVRVAILDVSHEGSAGLAGVQVQLVQNGKMVAQAQSDESGIALLPIARSGEGTVQFTLPNGYVVARDGGSFPYANCTTAGTFTVEIPLNSELNVTGQAIQSASVSGRLVEDVTNTGMIDDSCVPLSGYVVQAIDVDGQPVQQTTTDENGAYTLSNLLPDVYYIRFMLDDRYIATPYRADESSQYNAIYMQEPLFGETDAIFLSDGQQKVSVNGALFKAGIVDGYVMLNPAYDQLATNEGGAAGITVTLLDDTGSVWQDYAYDITDENGYFCIKGILPGTYSLRYALPEDAAFVAPASELNTMTGVSFVIENGSEIRVDPIGTVATATLAGHITDYASQAGVQANLTMTNQRTGAVFTTQTDAAGAFAFRHLLPDQYVLDVQLNNGYLFADSADSVLPYLNDSAASAMVMLPMGSVEENCNIVASLPVDWQAHFFRDANGNGTQDENEPDAAGRNVALYLRNDLVATVTTDANGIASFNHIIPGAYSLQVDLLDREMITSPSDDGQLILNQDGLDVALLQYAEISGQVWSLDQSTNGVGNIEILLVQDGQALQSCFTDENGNFCFTNLLQGEYQLRAILADGYLFARVQDVSQRSSYILSQLDGSSMYGLIPLQMGQKFEHADIGIGGMGSIGDTAWLDENKNGMQDIGESPMPGIVIELYQHGEFVAATTTDVYGRYSMTGLYPGAYEMHVTMPKEVVPTVRQTEYPLVASIMPESKETTVIVEEVIVPSNGRNLNLDLGFALKKKNVYPDCINDVPKKDWSSYPQPED